MMNIEAVGVALAVIAALGAATAYFARSRGTETIKLLQVNIAAYKDAEKIKDQRIAYLEGQIVAKDNTIEVLTQKALTEKARRRSDRK